MAISVPKIGLPGLQGLFKEERFLAHCIDFEADERNSHNVTEVGFASLSSCDVAGIEPGDRGIEYMRKITAEHWRNQDHATRNKKHLEGCPQKYVFGLSKFEDQANLPNAVQAHMDALVATVANSDVTTLKSSQPVPARSENATTALPSPLPSTEATVDDGGAWTEVVRAKPSKSGSQSATDQPQRSSPRSNPSNSSGRWPKISKGTPRIKVPPPRPQLPKAVNGFHVAHGCHDPHNDRKWAALIGLLWPLRGSTLEFDTQKIGAFHDRKPGVKRLCALLGIPTINEHNGGNDAVFELCLALAMAHMTEEQIFQVTQGIPLPMLPQIWPEDWQSIEQPKPNWLLAKEEEQRQDREEQAADSKRRQAVLGARGVTVLRSEDWNLAKSMQTNGRGSGPAAYTRASSKRSALDELSELRISPKEKHNNRDCKDNDR